MNKYLFTSQRLGFRNWKNEDLVPMSELNADEEVMEFFPQTYNLEATKEFIRIMQKNFDEDGFCFYAVDKLADNKFIGFIGLHKVNFDADFTPTQEIGWRLSRSAWNFGYATEGAKRCLEYGFEQLNFNEIYSFTPLQNIRSENVMKKIGMKKEGEFDHPMLEKDSWLKSHLLYKIEKPIIKL